MSKQIKDVREIRPDPIVPAESVLVAAARGMRSKKPDLRVIRRTTARLDAEIGGAQYNNFLRAVPQDGAQDQNAARYHWHIEICPRTSIPTGRELGSDLFVNTISSDAAAQRLREAPIEA